MRILCLTLLLCMFTPAPAAAGESAEPAPLPESHHDLARVLTDYLSRVELCLRSCTDAASTAAAIPQLRELAAEARLLEQRQQQLPEPTVQDYMASQELALKFLPLWKAIRAHIERLERDGLMTDQLRNLLQNGPQ